VSPTPPAQGQREPPTGGGRPSGKKRVRAPEAHRAAILEAARAAFAERGFAKATIRDVARRAGVTHGLVMRDFPSKEQLFISAVPGTSDVAANLAGDLDGLPERVARGFVLRMEAAPSGDPFVALVRSAASDVTSAKRLIRVMREESIAAYRTVLDVPDIAERVDFLGAHLTGVTFNRYVLQDGPLAAMSPDDLIRYLTATVRVILFGPAGGASGSPTP
jgi:AcrR family transcriptional regulator